MHVDIITLDKASIKIHLPSPPPLLSKNYIKERLFSNVNWIYMIGDYICSLAPSSAQWARIAKMVQNSMTPKIVKHECKN